MMGTLPRREREIFEILCSAGEATAAEVRARMADPPSYSAVRTLLVRLEAKDLVRHREVDQAYVYRCAHEGEQVRDSALQSLVKTFFEGSAAKAAAALLGASGKLKAEEIEALQKAIDAAKARDK